MSPGKFAQQPTETVIAAVAGLWATIGADLRAVRLERRWTARYAASEAGISVELLYQIERGLPTSAEAIVRVATALGRRINWQLLDPRRRLDRPHRSTDIVHSAMGEFEAAHFRPLGFATGLDEPYQHFQFAGRADFVAWDLERRALLHTENRTRFPDFQEMAGAFNAKKAYLGAALAERLDIRGWRSETHVIAALWSAEVLHALRLRPQSFRTLCPDPADAFAAWWAGKPPTDGKHTTLVMLDPLARGRQRPFVTLDAALNGVRPRHRGYVNVVEALSFEPGAAA
jgi:transcriptional regulator with XRE-family HTH domain